MQRLPYNWFSGTATALIALTLGISARAAKGPCFTCHEPEKTRFAPSAHAQAGLSCGDCHGGDPDATDKSAHDTEDFRRPGDKRAIAELCAGCHSDVRRMNPYGLPTDQLARYKTSRHGEQLFGHNNQNVAVCTDCHGAHDILKSTSPHARTYPANVPGTCGHCHSDDTLMSKYDLPSDIVGQYKSSYHAHLVLDKGDLSAPTCVTCHGSHGATPPGTKEVGEVCGKCHGRQRELFEQSPHAEAAEYGVIEECVACHGNHAIQKATDKLFDTACARCHEGDPKPMAVRDAVAGLIRRTEEGYERANERVHGATLRGLATDDEQLLLQEAETQVTQLKALQHALSPPLLRPVAARSDEVVNQVLDDVAGLERVEHGKRRALLPIWVFLGVMALLFWLRRRQLER